MKYLHIPVKLPQWNRTPANCIYAGINPVQKMSTHNLKLSFTTPQQKIWANPIKNLNTPASELKYSSPWTL